MNLSLRQLRVFIHVARIGNFTRAAEQAHMTQAGLSIMMREMEKQLDCRLFDRTTRMVVLTDAGRDLLPVAQRVIADIDGVVAQLGESGRKARQTLRIAATPLVSSNILPGVFTQFRRTHPHVELRLIDADLNQIQNMVSAGDVDLGLGFFFKQMPGMVRVPVGTFRLMRVAAATGPQDFVTGAVPWASLQAEPLISLPNSNPIQKLVETHLSAIGRGNEERSTFNFFNTLIAMVEAGMGSAVIPSFALAACHRHRVTTDLLIDPAVELSLYLVNRRGIKESDTMAEFREALAAALPTAG